MLVLFISVLYIVTTFIYFQFLSLSDRKGYFLHYSFFQSVKERLSREQRQIMLAYICRLPRRSRCYQKNAVTLWLRISNPTYRGKHICHFCIYLSSCFSIMPGIFYCFYFTIINSQCTCIINFIRISAQQRWV